MLMDMFRYGYRRQFHHDVALRTGFKRFCQKNGYRYSLNYSEKIMAEQTWIMQSVPELSGDMVFDEGKVTVPFDREMDQMFLATGTFRDGSKESYCGSRGWLRENFG